MHKCVRQWSMRFVSSYSLPFIPADPVTEFLDHHKFSVPSKRSLLSEIFYFLKSTNSAATGANPSNGYGECVNLLTVSLDSSPHLMKILWPTIYCLCCLVCLSCGSFLLTPSLPFHSSHLFFFWSFRPGVLRRAENGSAQLCYVIIWVGIPFPAVVQC